MSHNGKHKSEKSVLMPSGYIRSGNTTKPQDLDSPPYWKRIRSSLLFCFTIGAVVWCTHAAALTSKGYEPMKAFLASIWTLPKVTIVLLVIVILWHRFRK